MRHYIYTFQCIYVLLNFLYSQKFVQKMNSLCVSCILSPSHLHFFTIVMVQVWSTFRVYYVSVGFFLFSLNDLLFIIWTDFIAFFPFNSRITCILSAFEVTNSISLFKQIRFEDHMQRLCHCVWTSNFNCSVHKYDTTTTTKSGAKLCIFFFWRWSSWIALAIYFEKWMFFSLF